MVLMVVWRRVTGLGVGVLQQSLGDARAVQVVVVGKVMGSPVLLLCH